MPNRHPTRWVLLVAGGIAAAQGPITCAAADAANKNVTVQVGERLTHEDNLYRLPASIEPADLLGPNARRDDLISSTSAAIAGRWMQGEQELVLDALIAAHRFTENDDLDNTSGKGGLDWNWRFGSRWSGKAGGRRERTLASFANTASLEKDLFDTATYHGEAQFEVGPRLRATFSARDAATTHDNDARRDDDIETRSGAFGLEYHTPRSNSLGWEYRRARATFPFAIAVSGAGSASDYEERGTSLRLNYVLSEKVLFRGSAGYLERSYPSVGAGDFSGDVWTAALQWSPTGKTRIALQRWRELKAHLDAESDHFVSTGGGFVAAWSPIDQIDISLQLTREDQRYIGIAADALVEPARHDTPRARSLRLTYAPRDRVSFDLSYRLETRDSNRVRFDYDAASLSLAGDVKF